MNPLESKRQCELCCEMADRIVVAAGRAINLCFGCTDAHLDLPKLAAALEAARGRKCINPHCTTHGRPSIAPAAFTKEAREKMLEMVTKLSATMLLKDRSIGLGEIVCCHCFHDFWSHNYGSPGCKHCECEHFERIWREPPKPPTTALAKPRALKKKK